MSTVAKVNNRKRMCVSVEYFDDEPREPLCLTDEQWGIVALPQPKAASRAGSAADQLVKAAKRKAAQEELNSVRLGEEDLSNTLHFKYLGVMQSGDGDPLAPVNHRITKRLDQLSEPKKGAD